MAIIQAACNTIIINKDIRLSYNLKYVYSTEVPDNLSQEDIDMLTELGLIERNVNDELVFDQYFLSSLKASRDTDYIF